MEDIFGLEFQPQLDILYYFGCGGGGEGQYGHLRENLANLRDFQIRRPEIVAPLRDTVRLVHGNHGDWHPLEVHLKVFCLKSFWGNVEKTVFMVKETVVDGGLDFALPHPRVDGSGLDMAGAEVLNLILHKGNKRRDDDAKTAFHERRHLETDGFPASGGQ